MSLMIARFSHLGRQLAGLAVAGLATLALAAPVAAQKLERFDPDAAYSEQDAAAAGGIDADLTAPQVAPAPTSPSPAAPNSQANDSELGGNAAPPADAAAPLPELRAASAAASAANGTATYGENDLIGAAEGVFGKGAEGLAKLIEDLLRKQGEPNGYIVGREAGGAFIVGARYGSGTLNHKVEGSQPVYWTGPSVGFDVGANAASTFVLVYNLYDTETIFNRFPAGEGQAYLVGGLNASYLSRGDVVLIPIRVGAGLRLGVNAGYMKFSKEQKWVPF